MSTNLGNFTLHFPKQLQYETNPISGSEQRDHVFVGEEFDINIVAKSNIDPVEHNKELTKWKCTVQCLQPTVTVSGVPCESQIKKTLPTFLNTDNFSQCKPRASYKERLKVVMISDEP